MLQTCGNAVGQSNLKLWGNPGLQDLAGFRAAVRERCRAAGRTQQQLARAVGLHPNVLSHKLHQRGALLNAADATAIVTVLADWGAVGSVDEARGLLALMGVPERTIPAQAWTSGPLGALPRGPAPAAGPRCHFRCR
jgi:hypothetical protein